MPEAERAGAVPPAFAAAQAAFEQLWRARPASVAERRFTFAGRPVVSRVVGQTLADHTHRPFQHLLADGPAGTGPELFINLWDESLAGIPFPANLAGDGAQASWQIGHGRFETYRDSRFVCYHRPGSTTWFDRETGRMVGSRRSGEGLAVDERSKPLPLLLFIWYSDRGVQVVHAGLVVKNGRGALIGGASGSGKTTASLACLRAGWGYLGDDHVGLERRPDGSFVGHSLFNCARLEPSHLERFRELRPHAIPSDDPAEDKHLILLSQAFPERLERSATIRAIVLPRITGAEGTAAAPASGSEALRRLAPSTLTMPLSPGAPGFSRLAELVRQAPCYWLDLGRDVSDIAPCVEQVLAEAG